MITLALYNTLTRRKEKFAPLNKKRITFYYCGPTVYSHQHIGNLRGAMMADLVHRSLEYLDYNVTFVRNYTDVGHLTSDGDEGEDKMIKAAKKENLNPLKIAAKYIKLYEADTKELNIKEPNYKPRVTTYVENKKIQNKKIKYGKIQKMVATLIKKGYAYTTPLAVYYDVSKFPNYNNLNKQKITENIARAGTGDVQDPNKKHPSHFAIWFFKAGTHKNALQYWASPFKSSLVEQGYGFPGWHIECSAMANDLLGKTIDIHMGGVEHINVHHTNEIAQSEATNNSYNAKDITQKKPTEWVKYVNYWLHNEHLLVNSTKMSKSLGNVYLLKNILEKKDLHGNNFKSLDLRFLFLQAHYRSSQNFTWQALQSARNARRSLKMMIKRRLANSIVIDTSWEKDTQKEFAEKFKKALADDINIPRALAITFDVAQAVLKLKDKLTLLKKFDQVLQIGLTDIIDNYQKMSPTKIKEVNNLIAKRNDYRQNKEWIKADNIKKKLTAMKIDIIDTSQGTKWTSSL